VSADPNDREAWLWQQTRCRKCRVRATSMYCPEAPHERCLPCWRSWFNGGAKKHAGQWGERARIRRARRALKVQQRRETLDLWRWLNGEGRSNRKTRRAMRWPAREAM
jgi:hypothetical protein